jgi:hypothetical protein
MRLIPHALLLNDASQPHRPRAGLVLRSQAMPLHRRTTGSPPTLLAVRSFQPVAQRAVVAALEAPFRALALSRLDQVLQTPRPLHCRLAALSATPVALHPQLVFPLP